MENLEFCPKCKIGNYLEVERVDVDPRGKLWREIKCIGCGYEFTEEYTLVANKDRFTQEDING